MIWLYHLPNDKILDWPKLKAFADNILIADSNFKFDLERVENIVKKRRKCWSPPFSSFCTMFSITYLLGVVKSRDCVVNG